MKSVCTTLLIFFSISIALFGQEADTLSGAFIHKDSMRTYKLYAPAAYTGEEPWPLVISLHGYGLSANWMFNITGMNAVADTGRFLVVYPQGLQVRRAAANSPLPPFASGWNVGQESSNDDLGFINRLIDEISRSHNIDPARVYACGLSNGARMVNKLACELSDRIAATASVSGGLPDSLLCEPGRPFPIMYINGTKDPLVPLDGIPGVIKPLAEAIDFWTTNNNCEASPVETTLPDIVLADSSTITVKSYGNCEAGADVVLYQVENGGHPWPGVLVNPPPFLGNKNQDVSASVEIWNFFRRRRLPDSLAVTIASRIEIPFPDLKLYPNPFSDELNIELNLAEGTFLQLRLFNALGQPTAYTNWQVSSGRQHLQWILNQHQLRAGLYYLHLIANKKQTMRTVFYVPK